MSSIFQKIKRIWSSPYVPKIHLYVGDLRAVPVESARITRTSIRLVERESIKKFVEEHKSLLTGRVLDFGAGEEPYRGLVTGEYIPFEKGEEFPKGTFHTVLVNQVVQYLESPHEVFSKLASVGEYLVMTYPTNWEEIEDTDIRRYTKAGMEHMLKDAGYEILSHEKRCSVRFINFELVMGYGVVARSTYRN
jgi:hypothetical protein